jgi:hypothetical protein
VHPVFCTFILHPVFCLVLPGQSVNAFERFLKLEKRLLGLQPSPHGDRPPNQPALLLEAIVFDHPLDAGETIGAVTRNWHHPGSVLSDRFTDLSPIAQWEKERRDGGWPHQQNQYV